MIPAAKHLDPIVGVDIHIIQPPGPVPPVPIPHPHVGMIFDPMDYVPMLGATVYIAGLPRAQAGTACQPMPPAHIPIGGMFVMPPGNESEVFMGSSTVSIDGDAATYMALPVLSCQSVGMMSPVRPKKPKKTTGFVLPTTTALSIPVPVLIGGPPTVSLMALGMRAGMAAAGRALRGLASRARRAMRSSRRMRRLSHRLHRAADSAMDRLGISNASRLRNRMHRTICSVTGHPVDVATGKVFTEVTDLSLPGPLPLTFERVWYSTSAHDGALGRGWHHSYDLGLAIEDDAAIVRLADGRYAVFEPPTPAAPSWNAQEQAWLRREVDGYVLEMDATKERYHFGPPRRDAVVGSERPWQPLLRVEDRNGNAITFRYDGRDRLTRIVDSAGRHLDVECDTSGRIRQILGPHPTAAGERVVLLRYRYDARGRLVEAHDALGAPLRYGYDAEHRLVEETDRAGVSFYFAYEGSGTDARCVRTWGTGGIFERHLTYDQDAQTTTVVDTRGGETVHHWNALGLVERKIDPLGGEHRTEYDPDGRILSETDPLGHTTEYAYDDSGRLTTTTDPLGHTQHIDYDESGHLIAFTNEAGDQALREVDASGNVAAVVDPEGQAMQFHVDERGLPRTITDRHGHEMQLDWDEAGNLVCVTDRTNATTRLHYDALGNLVGRVDAEGHTSHLERDLLGRVTAVHHADGSQSRFRYDNAGNPVSVTDPMGRTRQFTYGPDAPGGRLRRVREPSGAETRHAYDREGLLATVEDAQQRRWVFTRDRNGRLVTERDFAGRSLHYTYDATGRLASTTDARGNRTEFERDPLGRLIQATYADDQEETFAYDPCGRLTSVVNAAADVRFSYDAFGRVVREEQNGVTVRSRYDATGNRIERHVQDGRSITFGYDAENRMAQIETEAGRLLDMIHSPLGHEIERRLPGGLMSQRAFTPTGDRRSQRLARRGATDALLDRQYEYDAAGQLTQLRDSRWGTHQFQHDLDGFLTSVSHSNGEVEQFRWDAAGNVPAAPVRLHPAGGDGHAPAAAMGNAVPQDVSAVQHAEGWTLAYDADGNLVSKRRADTHYRFDYDASNRLIRAERDGKEVARFAYDAFGRRVGKETSHYRVTYLWDGNTLAEERTEPLVPSVEAPNGGGPPSAVGHTPRRIRQYVFQGFEPLAVLDDDRDVVLETDPVGRPCLAVDKNGRLVWEAHYGGFGTVRDERTADETTAITLRFAGQIHDPETGLSYNRFRYYDPDLRCFTQPDPVGLIGGTHPQNYVSDPTRWLDPFGLDCSADAAVLRQNMVNAGRQEPPYPNAAHHIVQSNSPDAVSEATRAHLQRHNIDINDPDNGVFLPTSSSVRDANRASPAPHSRAHTNEVRQHVHDRITSKTSEAEIRQELRSLQDEFRSGRVPGRTDYTPPSYP